MTIARLILSALAIACALPSFAVADPEIGPARGTLVIVGGGGGGKDGLIFKRFVELAGGPQADIVVIPTAMEGEDYDTRSSGARIFRDAGATKITVMHTRDRTLADTEAFIRPLRTATGVWFGGGRQWRLADSYLNTRAQAAVLELLNRGGVVGGSSAGATIQGSYLVRGAVEGNEVMMSPGHEEGFALLKNVAIDQHVIRRKRIGDLVPVIEAHPELLGIGIDERTAIVVRQDQFEVIGDSDVVITDPNRKVNEGEDPWYLLKPGDRFDLKTRSRIATPAETPSSGN
ncbi:MAG TPA: cyanophycinase [Caulifigura sp.]|nr:cyanophycinase [Caulifigura sp.]